MPIVHIERLEGDGAEKWLAFAKSELRRYRLLEGTGSWMHTIAIPDGTVRVRQVGDLQYIDIVVSNSYMEFETSGFPVRTATFDQSGFSRGGYLPAVVSVSFDGKKAVPVIRTGSRHIDAASASLIKRSANVLLTDEPAQSLTTPDSTKTSKYPNVLYRAWAPNHPFTGVYARAYNNGSGVDSFHYMRGSVDAQFTRDVLFDVPYQDGHKTRPVRRAYVRDTADWPRSCGIQTVQSAEFGTREFAIYVDAFDQFYAFPTSQIKAVDPAHLFDQNVDATYVKKAAVTWPSWMYRKTERFSDFFAANPGDIGVVDFPEYDWKLHPDGTKACAVVFQREPAVFDTAYFSAAPGGFPLSDFPLSVTSAWSEFNRHNVDFQPGHLPQRYCIGTGLVEVSLAITLTGDKPENFTFAATVAEVRNPANTLFCSFIAGYVWTDVPNDGTPAVASRGDLVVLDIERYFREDNGAGISFFSVKNLTQSGAEISSWYGGDYLVSSTLIDYDIASLSFVFNIKFSEVVDRNPTGLTRNHLIVHQAAAIVTFNTLRTVLFPDALSPANRDKAQAAAAASGRSQLTTLGGAWTFVPQNDPTKLDWGSPDLLNLRKYKTNAHNNTAYGGVTTPSTALINWFGEAGGSLGGGGLNATNLAAGVNLLFLTTPRFGWYAYADEIMNRMAVSARSTFYVHPNGSWAFWDQHNVYNDFGINETGAPGGDTLGQFLAQATVEHVIYDAVHLENKKGSLDTSFIELYNAAVAKLSPPFADADAIFDPITKADIRADIVKQTVVPSGYSVRCLQLAITWPQAGPTFYYIEPAQLGDELGSPMPGGGGAIDLTLGDFFFGEPTGTTGLITPSGFYTPVTFSSVVMIT